MERNFRKEPAQQGAGASPPSEAWLFAQALLGKPVPSTSSAQADARAKREHLEWLAQISPEDARRVRGQLSEEAEARAQRKQLEWLAAISPEHERKLRSLLQAEASETHERLKWLSEDAAVHEAQWDPAKHPRLAGPPNPGWWATTGGLGAGSSRLDPSGIESEPPVVDKHNAPPGMLELANAWWKTNNLLLRVRRDITQLPKLIADEEAQLRKGGLYALVHLRNLTKAKEELETAKELVRQLPGQLRALEQQYHDSGFDKVVYSTWTPGETLISGRGIEQVGSALDAGGSPPGLTPTGIEFDIALAAPAVLQLGNVALKKALGKFPSRAAELTGQQHHAISQPIYNALEDSPGLGGQYRLRDPRLASRAKDLASHKGYQQWHRSLDQEIRQWVKDNPKATPAQFEKWLKRRYNKRDLRDRFPKGFGGGK